MTITYSIQFYEYWHSSSGLSAGTQAALAVRKTKMGLPLLPGKTLKGLLNEAAYKLHDLHPDLVSQTFLQEVFGTGDDDYNVDTNIDSDAEKSKASQCFFSNAELSAQLTQALTNSKSAAQQKRHLYTQLASTAMDKKGLAIDNTLRTIEATVPLTLYAKIVDFPDKAAYLKSLKYCMQWVKKAGLNRTRGMGRCTFSIIDPQN